MYAQCQRMKQELELSSGLQNEMNGRLTMYQRTIKQLNAQAVERAAEADKLEVDYIKELQTKVSHLIVALADYVQLACFATLLRIRFLLPLICFRLTH